MADRRAGTRYSKSRLNQVSERDATKYVMGVEARFQKPDRAVKRRILELLDLPKEGEWTHHTFDLVLTPPNAEELTVANAERYIGELLLIEVKATRKAIRSNALNGFFFGTTARQYELARAAKGRYLYAFVVLNDDNEYGHPFYVLVTPERVDERTQSKRLQYQVQFKRDSVASPDEQPSGIPLDLLKQVRAEPEGDIGPLP